MLLRRAQLPRISNVMSLLYAYMHTTAWAWIVIREAESQVYLSLVILFEKNQSCDIRYLFYLCWRWNLVDINRALNLSKEITKVFLSFSLFPSWYLFCHLRKLIVGEESHYCSYKQGHTHYVVMEFTWKAVLLSTVYRYCCCRPVDTAILGSSSAKVLLLAWAQCTIWYDVTWYWSSKLKSDVHYSIL